MKVFYTPKMVADSKSYSPSAGKPALAVGSWVANRKFKFDVVAPAPATKAQLTRAHDAAYVAGVLKCKVANGFGNRSKQVAESLAYTSGAMIAAAHEAINTGGFACAPVSGFHHAGFNHGGGFCTFNGLMVAALDLLESGKVRRVGILDCDQHYGNGTDDIIDRLGLEDKITHYTTGASRMDAVEFLELLPDFIRATFSDCDVLLYQAGADPHVNDPLGGWMTTSQLYERDIVVFETARQMHLPVAWDLAGGYQKDQKGEIPKVLEIHSNTMKACLRAY